MPNAKSRLTFLEYYLLPDISKFPAQKYARYPRNGAAYQRAENQGGENDECANRRRLNTLGEIATDCFDVETFF